MESREKANKEYPLISVIVPTYERSALLTRVLDSIYDQSWDRIQVVVVDDNVPGSDWERETREAIKPYRSRKDFLYVKTSGKLGGGGARNLGMRQCSGDYVAFLDDDDRFLPDKLLKQIHFILENELDGCYQDVIWKDDREKLVEYRSLDFTGDFSKEGLLKAHILHSLCPTSVYMLRRDKVLETQGFGEVSSGQDFILMLRCIEHGLRLAYMPGAYVVQYLHRGPRISLGDSKIRGENMLYELKHQYFPLLLPEERRYVKFRHFAVLAFASARNKKLLHAFGYALRTVAASPADCVKDGIRFFKSNLRRD